MTLMKMKAIVSLMLAALFIFALVPIASAAPFLCPVVGDGVLHAPGRADAVITPPVGT